MSNLPVPDFRIEHYERYLAGEGNLEDLPKPGNKLEQYLYGQCVNRDVVTKCVIISNKQNSIYKHSATNDIIAVGYHAAYRKAYINDLTDGGFKMSDGEWSTKNLGYPSNCNFIYKVIIFKGYIYAIGKDTVDNLWKVWRTVPNDNSTVLSWSAPVWVARDTTVSVVVTACFNCNSDYIFIGEYGFRTVEKNPILYRSSDGINFANIYQLTNSDHIHSVTPDPYINGSVWMCSGEPEGMIYHSPDNGTTWTKVVTTFGHQAVQVSFTKDNVYFAEDCRIETCFVINKNKMLPFSMANNYHAEFGVPGAAALRDTFYNNAFYGATTEQGVYYGIIQDSTSGGTTAGVVRCLGLGEDLALISHGISMIKTKDNYALLAEVYVGSDRIFFNQYWMYKTKIAKLSAVT